PRSRVDAAPEPLIRLHSVAFRDTNRHSERFQQEGAFGSRPFKATEYVGNHADPPRDRRRQPTGCRAVAFARLYRAKADCGPENGRRGTWKYSATDSFGP